MFTNKNILFAVLSVTLFNWISLRAQDTLILSHKVGKEIDSLEKREHKILPYFSNKTFIKAVFLKLNDSTLIVSARLKNDSVANKKLSRSEFEFMKQLIEKEEYSPFSSNGSNASAGKLSLSNSEGQFLYNGNYLNYKKLKELIDHHPDPAVRLNLNESFEEMLEYERRAMTSLGNGIGFGLGVPTAVAVISGFINSVAGNDVKKPLLIGAAAGVAIMTIGIVNYKFNKKNCFKVKRQIADRYNLSNTKVN